LLGGNNSAAAANSEGSEPQGERKVKYWQAPMDPTFVSDKPGKSPMGMDLIPVYEEEATPPQGERKIKYWQAPMDPTFISDKPGKSPMGMDLIPVYEDEYEEAPAGTIRIDPVFVQNIGVQSIELERTDIPFTIRTVGNLTYDDSQIAWVNTKYDGWIEKVYVNYIGEPVDKGQKLFEIYSPELVTTQKEYLQALEYADLMRESNYPEIADRAQSLLDSSRERLEYWDITDEQIEELEKTRQLRRTLAVVSPLEGLVEEKMDKALEGMYVKAGMNLYKIVDLSNIWVEVEIFENQVPWMKLGQTALIELPYDPGKQYVGKVRYFYPFFNNKTRTMKVSIEMPNPGKKLRGEMYANVTFDVPSAKNVLAVPEEAVIHSGTRNIVVLDQGNGTFRVKEITLGVNGAGVWEVKDGLEEGDRVVVSAQFLIASESNLQEAIRKMISEKKGSGETTQPPPMPEHQH
jgi:Cu(I)/Ag(I) efflux system membrane fusion protein/cobalt-zinc-cadmium efflux system membrane fusion protein